MVSRSRKSKKVRQDNGKKENDKTLHIKLKIEQHKSHQEPNRYKNNVSLVLKLIDNRLPIQYQFVDYL